MGKKLCGLVVLVFSLFVFCSRGICSEDDLRAKIEERLKLLKKTISQEQAMLRTLNENLTAENNRLFEENAQLKEAMARFKGESPQLINRGAARSEEEMDSIAYLQSKLDLALEQNARLQEEIKQPEDSRLSQENTRLSKLLREAQNEQGQLTQEISNLKRRPQNDSRLSQENIRLSEALREAQNEQRQLIQEIDNLKSRPGQEQGVIYQTDPQQEGEINNLNQQLAALKQQLQEQVRAGTDKDKQIKELNQAIDYVYGKLSEFSQMEER